MFPTNKVEEYVFSFILCQTLSFTLFQSAKMQTKNSYFSFFYFHEAEDLPCKNFFFSKIPSLHFSALFCMWPIHLGPPFAYLLFLCPMTSVQKLLSQCNQSLLVGGSLVLCHIQKGYSNLNNMKSVHLSFSYGILMYITLNRLKYFIKIWKPTSVSIFVVFQLFPLLFISTIAHRYRTQRCKCIF